MRTLSAHIARLILHIRETPSRKDWSEYDGPRLTTNTITSRAGTFYEKLRYTLDYQDENTIRRSAIERTLRRLNVYEDKAKLGEVLLMELIRSGYIANDSVPEELTSEVQSILQKFARLKTYGVTEHRALLSHTATEIEQHLFPVPHREAVLDAMYHSVRFYLEQKEKGAVTDETFQRYVYVACRRVFLRNGPEEIRYALWRMHEPHWQNVALDDTATLQDIASRFDAHVRDTDTLLHSEVPVRIQARLHNESIYAALLMELVRQYGVDIQVVLGEPERLGERVRSYLTETYATHRAKIQRSGTRAVLYILITKVLIGLAVELPYELFVLGQLNYLSLGINMVFFPLLLLLMVKTIRLPQEKNTALLIEGMERFITGAYPAAVRIKMHPMRTLSALSFGAFYLLLSVITFGVLLTVLSALEFNAASMVLFLFFLMIVSYFGLRIRYKARAWTYDTDSESALGLLWYLLFLPVTRTGRWISDHLSSVNIFVFFLDFILETPFKLILASFDEFVSFTKEMRRDMQ